MAHIVADRVLDITVTVGTIPFVVNGAAQTTYQNFSDVCQIGDTLYYACISDTQYEIAKGTYTAVNTITRNAADVYAGSSGAGNLVNFTAGDKTIWITDPAIANRPISAVAPISYNFSTNQLSLSTSGINSGEFLVNNGGTWAASVGLTYDISSQQLLIKEKATPTANSFVVTNHDNSLKRLYVDTSGHTHIGWTTPYTTGGLTYRDSKRLYFDTEYFSSGVRQTYIEAVPNTPGVQNQHKLRFIVEGNELLALAAVGAIVVPTGIIFGNSSSWYITGSTMRTTNTVPGFLRGEFNYIQLQGEVNTTGQYDLRFVGKNPFGGATASNIAGFFSDTTIKLSVTKDGYLNFASGLNIAGYSTTSADPTTTEIPTDKMIKVHKNSSTSTVYLAYNDSGSIKKVPIGPALPAGSDTQIQFNDAGALAGHAGLVFDKTNRILKIPAASGGSYATGLLIDKTRALVLQGDNTARELRIQCDNSFAYIQAFRDQPSNETLPFLFSGKTMEIQTGQTISGGNGLVPAIFASEVQRIQIGNVDRNVQAQLEIKIKTSSTIGMQIRAVSGQSVDLTQFLSSAGTTLVSINSTGKIFTIGGMSSPINVGSQSEIFGEGAGGAMTAGIKYNTMFGYLAGNKVTSGTDNTIIGSWAGQNITSAIKNTMVGSNSGWNMISGNQNVGVGSYTLGGSGTGMTGGGNTTLGDSAGSRLSSGNNNVFVGLQAGQYVTTGSSNILIGSNAGAAITSGSSSIVVGLTAGNSLTTGAGTVAVGEAAGFYNVTGNYNTYLGYWAHGSGQGGTSNNLNYVTCIGAFSDARTSNTVNFSAQANEIIGLGYAESTIRERGSLLLGWTDSTDATRKAWISINAYDTTRREGIRIEADGIQAMLGFYGAIPIPQPTALTAEDTGIINTGDATTDDVVENLRTRLKELEDKLKDLGLLA